MTTYLRVRKFSELQHYTNRPSNPWIRFYVRVLDDEELNALPIATRLLFNQFLLLAQRFGNAIPNDSERIAGLTAIPQPNVREGIQELLSGGWLSETGSSRRASKRATKPATKNAIPHARPRAPADSDSDTDLNLGVALEAKGYSPNLVWQEKDNPPDFNFFTKPLEQEAT